MRGWKTAVTASVSGFSFLLFPSPFSLSKKEKPDTQGNTQLIMCLKKYTEDYVSPWKQILSFFVKDYSGKFLLHCNFSVADLTSCLPNFYRECFEVWCNLSVKHISSREQAISQLLWNSPFLHIGGKPIFNKMLFSKGLISLANILTNTGSLKTLDLFLG